MTAIRRIPRVIRRILGIFDLEARVGEFISALVILAWVYQSYFGSRELSPVLTLDLVSHVAPLEFWHCFAAVLAVLQAGSLLAPPGRLLSYTRWLRFGATVLAAYWWGVLTLALYMMQPHSVTVAAYAGYFGINVYGFVHQLPWRRRWMI